jgi:hypothetical protein
MTTEQAQTKKESTRQEQIDTLLPLMRRMLPGIVEVAQLYHKNYPVMTTLPEVVDAVTVAVPLRHFMVMASIVTNLCVIAQEKEANTTPDQAAA